nr:mediator of RNA polymerase II transcription subunit 15A-like isoform X1 [Ipomoea batatas]
MDADYWMAAQAQRGGTVLAAPDANGAAETEDWRTQLQTDSRERIVNKIMETLKRHLPHSGEEGLQELRKIAMKFEEKIYIAATSPSDYLMKISLKMLSMERGDWRTQLQPESRQRIVNKIMETLKRHLPFSGPEGLQEIKKIAVRFEEKIYSAASSQNVLWLIYACKALVTFSFST